MHSTLCIQSAAAKAGSDFSVKKFFSSMRTKMLLKYNTNDLWVRMVSCTKGDSIKVHILTFSSFEIGSKSVILVVLVQTYRNSLHKFVDKIDRRR